MKKRKVFEVNKRQPGKKIMEKNLNDFNFNWDSTTEMAKDREHWKKCCKNMLLLNKNFPDTI